MHLAEPDNFNGSRSNVVRSGTTAGSLALGPLDWINACDYPAQLFVYERALDTGTLERSLQRLLQDFPAFSGRCSVARDGVPSILLNDGGVPFTEQQSPFTLQDFLEQRSSLIQAGEFTDKFAAFKSASTDAPMLAVRVTHLAGGGSVLGVTHFHGVCDGGGMFQFFDAWNKAAQGLPYPPPLFDRAALRRLQEPFSGDTPSAHDSFPGISLLELMQLFNRVKNLADRSTRRVVHFSAADLAGLRRRALAQGQRPSKWFSAQDLLVAHLWREVAMAQQDDAPVALSYILDLRRRHGFDLSELYIGNAHSIRSGTLARADLEQSSVIALAQRVREISDNADPVSVGQDIAYLSRCIPGSNKLHITQSALRPAETLTVNNLSGLRCYDVDFGTGKPLWYVPPEYPGCRIAHIVPSPASAGSFDVHIKLEDREMARLRERHESMHTVD